jgi:two-component system cit operon sensor histidine kinase CitA
LKWPIRALASPEIRERILSAASPPKRGDHGIGLYLIESYVTQAGGAIEVADNTPRGAFSHCLFPPREPPAFQLEDTDYAT